MKLEELKNGKKVRFIEAAGLGDKEYLIHSVDQMSWTVRLDGAMGSYSIDHIIGFDATPTIPASESGTLETAAAFPTSVPRVLPKPENPLAPDDETQETKEDKTTSLPSVFDALAGLEVVDLLDALEGHLQALVAHPDPLVKYHARNALMIQWTIEAHPGEEQPQESSQEEIKEDDSTTP